MSALDDLLKKHRKKIIDREEQTFREMLQAYAEIERDLKRSINELQKKIEEAQAAGDEISKGWLMREHRLQSLLDQVEEQIIRFGDTAARLTGREQRAAIELGIEQSLEIIGLVSGKP